MSYEQAPACSPRRTQALLQDPCKEPWLQLLLGEQGRDWEPWTALGICWQVIWSWTLGLGMGQGVGPEMEASVL